MVIRVNKSELFEKWLEWLNPLIPLKNLDRKVLAALITLHYLYKERYSDETLQELLLSEDTKEIISKRLNISINQINKAYNNFKESGIITDKNTLNKALTNYPKNNRFRILIDFEIIDWLSE